MMARRKKKATIEDKDRISKLPDELIHQIMMFMGDIRFAIQTSVLSKRWKLLWTTLPFLNFSGYDKYYFHKRLVYYKILKNVFSRRNHDYRILKLDLHHRHGLTLRRLEKYVKYAVSHHVERLDVRSDNFCSFSVFSSKSLSELKLSMDFESDYVMKSKCWSLPKLTTLCLVPYKYIVRSKFPESCLICLPALTTLVLDRIELPDCFSLPGLKTLCLESCNLPGNVWDLPALLTLQLTSVHFPEDSIKYYFIVLASLRNLTIDFGEVCARRCEINNSQLVNLNIRAPLNSVNVSNLNVVVWAPKLCNFNAIGFFRTTLVKGFFELKNLNVKFWDQTMYRRNKEPSWVLNRHTDLFKMMFSQLGSAEILSVDLVTLQALSGISDIVEHLDSPFYNLNYLKLPRGCDESSISTSVRQYLLGGSPSATIVKT